MNELLLLLHILIITGTLIVMLRIGSYALVSFLCAQAILANLFVLKQITLFGLTATASDVYIVGSVLTLNVVQEYYGKSLARRAIWISFVLMLFFTVASQIHLLYIPDATDFCQHAYKTILGFMPRLAIASMCTYVIVQYFDTFFYAILKKVMKSYSLVIRNMISISVSQMLDTVLFSLLGLYGLFNNLGQVMAVSFAIKMITMLALTPCMMVISSFKIKKSDH